jgi:hypothetical protein
MAFDSGSMIMRCCVSPGEMLRTSPTVSDSASAREFFGM